MSCNPRRPVVVAEVRWTPAPEARRRALFALLVAPAEDVSEARTHLAPVPGAPTPAPSDSAATS